MPTDARAVAIPSIIRSTPSAAWVGAAWLVLAISDVLLKLAGFNRFHRVVGRSPLLGTAAPPGRAARAREWCAAMDRARAYYFRRAWCLQSAGAAVLLLRAAGVPAQMVIGVRKIPFVAHAWVEVDGAVVLNDRESLREHYREMVRC